MLDINKRKKFHNATVNDIISYLSELNHTATVTVLGNPDMYIHVDDEGSVIFDNCDLEYEYAKENLNN
jgi:hypothetical protein